MHTYSAMGNIDLLGAMKSTTGTITLVQEHRFQLQDDQGSCRLFILAHDAKQQWEDLEHLERNNVHVTVYYSDAGALLACTAHDVHELPSTVD